MRAGPSSRVHCATRVGPLHGPAFYTTYHFSNRSHRAISSPRSCFTLGAVASAWSLRARTANAWAPGCCSINHQSKPFLDIGSLASTLYLPLPRARSVASGSQSSKNPTDIFTISSSDASVSRLCDHLPCRFVGLSRAGRRADFRFPCYRQADAFADLGLAR